MNKLIDSDHELYAADFDDYVRSSKKFYEHEISLENSEQGREKMTDCVAHDLVWTSTRTRQRKND